MKKISWGIISTANIGVAKVIPGMLKSGQLEVAAISSRTLNSARKWAEKLGIPKAYGSYEEMLADPDIDAVYNPLPNHLHVPLTLAAAKAGKHVLCEKPSRSPPGKQPGCGPSRRRLSSPKPSWCGTRCSGLTSAGA